MDPKTLNTLKTQVWPILKAKLEQQGVTLAAFLAAYFLIPDHAVMSKEEIAEGVELPQRELALRKIAVVTMAGALKSAVGKTIDIGTLLAQGKTPTLRHAASLLIAAPAFFTTYKLLRNRLEKGDGTMNFRDVAPTTGQAFGLAAAKVGGYGAIGYSAAKQALEAMNHVKH